MQVWGSLESLQAEPPRTAMKEMRLDIQFIPTISPTSN